jgi:uncharacterized protein (DUF2235 family)
MNKRIVLCLDGTWNQVREPEEVTNVVKLAQAVLPVAGDGTQQVVYYNSGLGTGDVLDKFLGGVFGRGLRSNVKRAYAFLSLNYEPTDEIYIFGFSRGAYTARALAGVVVASGILRKQEFEKFELVWNHYRKDPRRRGPRPSGTAGGDTPRGSLHRDARVRCVGVWDTVGAYGIPAGLGLGALARYFTSWVRGFHDTQISNTVDIGLHALALDECRRPFTPTLWTGRKGPGPKAHVEQVWFPGAHSDIGGGYRDTGLSNLTLHWMTARAAALGHTLFKSSLEFDPAFLDEARGSAKAIQHRPERGWPVSRIFRYRRPVLAGTSTNGRGPVNERIHWSVVERLGQKVPVEGCGTMTYAPVNLEGDIPKDRVVSPEEEDPVD